MRRWKDEEYPRIAAHAGARFSVDMISAVTPRGPAKSYFPSPLGGCVLAPTDVGQFYRVSVDQCHPA